MITNFQLFEKTYPERWGRILKYDKNDYVLIDSELVEKTNDDNLIAGEPPDELGKIEKINNDDEYPYHILFFNNQKLQFRPEEIIRKLTPNEIVEYELKKSTIKYNL